MLHVVLIGEFPVIPVDVSASVSEFLENIVIISFSSSSSAFAFLWAATTEPASKLRGPLSWNICVGQRQTCFSVNSFTSGHLICVAHPKNTLNGSMWWHVFGWNRLGILFRVKVDNIFTAFDCLQENGGTRHSNIVEPNNQTQFVWN